MLPPSISTWNSLLPLALLFFSSPFTFASPSSSPRSSSSSPPTVHLPYATVSGYYNSTSNLDVYSSIRFATAPIGENRWKLAQPPKDERKNGTIDVSKYPPRCPQATGVLVNTSDPNAALEDEDCLFLSVYTPAGRSSHAKNLPVLVWIHGGGWDHNSIREFDPTPMLNSANNSFVAVIIQYRLGIFGFLAPPSSSSSSSSPNVGITDARAALAWTRENICLFGGDKEKVTIWGQSSGGGTVLHLVAAEKEQKGPALFRSSVVSSPYLVPMGSCDGADYKDQFHRLSAAANCTDDLACLRRAPTALLQSLDFQFKSILQPGRPSAYEPCIENANSKNAYLVKNTAQQLLAKRVAGSYAIAGSNTHDGLNFAPKTLNVPSNATNLTSASDAIISTFLVKDWPLQPAHVSTALALYPASQYVDGQARGAAIFQDAVFACPATWLVQAFPKTGYRYLYAVTDAEHARDNAYEFPIKYSGLSPNSPTLSASYIGAVTSFITSSPPNPNTTPSPILVSGEQPWPAFGRDFDGPFKVLNLTVGGANISTSRIERGDVAELGLEVRCEFWARVRVAGGW